MAEPVLYGNDVSGYCCKVRIVLAHKSIAFAERSPPDGYGSPAYRAVVPTGTIPALVVDDLVLSESEAIVEFLDEAWPVPAMLPGNPAQRARLRQLSRFHDSRLEPPLRALFGQVAPAGRDEAVVSANIAFFRGTACRTRPHRRTLPAAWRDGADARRLRLSGDPHARARHGGSVRANSCHAAADCSLRGSACGASLRRSSACTHPCRNGGMVWHQARRAVEVLDHDPHGRIMVWPLLGSIFIRLRIALRFNVSGYCSSSQSLTPVVAKAWSTYCWKFSLST